MCILTNRFSCWIPCCDAFLGLRSPDVFGYGSDSRHKHLCFLSAEQFLRCSLQGKNISPNSSHCDLDANLHPNHSKSAGAGCTSLRFFQLLARNSLWKRNPIRHLFQQSKIYTDTYPQPAVLQNPKSPRARSWTWFQLPIQNSYLCFPSLRAGKTEKLRAGHNRSQCWTFKSILRYGLRE